MRKRIMEMSEVTTKHDVKRIWRMDGKRCFWWWWQWWHLSFAIHLIWLAIYLVFLSPRVFVAAFNNRVILSCLSQGKTSLFNKIATTVFVPFSFPFRVRFVLWPYGYSHCLVKGHSHICWAFYNFIFIFSPFILAMFPLMSNWISFNPTQTIFNVWLWYNLTIIIEDG